jgi:hypothetical protein
MSTLRKGALFVGGGNRPGHPTWSGPKRNAVSGSESWGERMNQRSLLKITYHRVLPLAMLASVNHKDAEEPGTRLTDPQMRVNNLHISTTNG